MKSIIVTVSVIFFGLSLLTAVYAETSMEGSDLTGASLKNCNLSGVNFKNSTLRNVNFQGANLSNTVFHYSILLAVSR